jgi:hypothetical protein
MTGLTLDAGALIGLERGSTRVRGVLSAAGDRRLRIPAPVLAQVWRSGSRQALLSRLLDGDMTEVVALDRVAAQAVGGLLAASSTRDVVDAAVVICAWTHDDVVVTSDPEDLRVLDPGLRLVAL